MFVTGFKFFLGGIAAKWVEGLFVILLFFIILGGWYLYLVMSDKYTKWKRSRQ